MVSVLAKADDGVFLLCCGIPVALVAIPWLIDERREQKQAAAAQASARANPNAARLAPQLAAAMARAGASGSDVASDPLVFADEWSDAIGADDVLEAIRCGVDTSCESWVWILTGRVIASPDTPPDRAIIWPRQITDIQRQGYRLLVTMRHLNSTVALTFGGGVAALDNLNRAERLIREAAR